MSEEIYLKIARNVKLLRLTYSLSQKELSALTDISRPDISLIESGRRRPSISSIESIAKGLGLKTSALIEEDLANNLKVYLEKYKLSQ